MKQPGMKFTTYLDLVPRLRMSGAIPVFPLYAFMAWVWTTLLLSFAYKKGGKTDCSNYQSISLFSPTHKILFSILPRLTPYVNWKSLVWLLM
jgi:hypothetical protein